MKSAYQAINKTCIGLMLGGCLAAPVCADDIEIYTDANLVGPLSPQANIMFVMDSSAGMDAMLPVDEPYNYTRTYDLTGGYDPAKIYYTADGSIPATNGDYFDSGANLCLSSLQEYVPESYTIPATETEPETTISAGFQGANTGSLYTTGMYSGQIAQYNAAANKLVWQTPVTNNATTRAYAIECIQDHGLHGADTASGHKFIANRGATGWSVADEGVAAAVWANNANNYVLFAGNYLNYRVDPALVPSDLTLFQQLKNAISTLVASASNINIGLMQYDGQRKTIDGIDQGSEGGSVQYPVLDVNLGRNDFYSRLKTMNTGADPVIAETYFEALRYFGGKAVHFGDDAVPKNQTGTKESGNPSHYETPITVTCQKNHIIIVSNGLSRYDYIDQVERDSIPGFVAGSCNTGPYAGWVSNQDAFNTDGSTIDNCLDEMAGWALNNDVAERIFPAHEGDQNITTYTVGFAFPSTASDELLAGEQLLRDTATKGGGRFMVADNEADLVRALNELVSEILKVNSTFSSPAVSVNAFNRATNLEDLYYTLFKPADGERWEGNLKKFKLELDASGNPYVADKNSNRAIDTATGFFKEASVSYWTEAADAPDGAETAKGGAASKIALPRNTYTFTGTYSSANGVLTPSATGKILKSAANGLGATNADITDAMLGGVAGEPTVLVAGVVVTYREALLRWSYGEDIKDTDGDSVFTEVRREMGDPLHAEPALVQYGELTGELTGGIPDLVAYVATNDGYLHAVDTITGKENFAFVPQEMLPKLQNIFDNTGATGKAYGLDGNVVAWINDVNSNGTIDAATDHVYLYFGMRRGGRYLYSMDVTDRNNPTLRWVLDGGTGKYAEMGQTWSAPNVANIKMGGVERTVLIFGAGYDTGQDVLTTRGVDLMGRGIFIVDADTGALLWRAGPAAIAPATAPNLTLANMVYSIPARITTIDVDGDGYTDRLYAGDMGGQLWRIDINNADDDNASVSATGGRIANLAADSSTTDNRRFYNSPDVAVILEDGKAPYISIVAASGYRAHPLQTATHDRAYMIRDHNVYDVPATYTTLTEADLFDTTANLIGEGSTALIITTAKDTLNSKQGWFITFQEWDGTNATYVGEKALSEPLILNGVAIFTTFIPASAGLSSSSCKANDGTGAIYYVNVVDGTPTRDNSEDGNVTRVDRRILLARGGIPPTPRLIITSDGTSTECVGTECKKSDEMGATQKMYWYEVAQ